MRSVEVRSTSADHQPSANAGSLPGCAPSGGQTLETFTVHGEGLVASADIAKIVGGPAARLFGLGPGLVPWPGPAVNA